MFPRAKKSFGQNFLADPHVVQGILAVAELKKGERVLEIGPGTGVLTVGLLETGAHVVAVEADPDMVQHLRATTPPNLPLSARGGSAFGGERGGDALDLIEGDILSLRRADPTLGGRLEEGKYKLVANIPYNITSAILEEFLSRTPHPVRLVLMVQREVADRIVAPPPDMSLLSVVCQIYTDVRRAIAVPRGAFRPSPKVDSAVVVLDWHPKTDDPERVIRLAKAGFSAPRKQVHGNLAHAGYGTSDEVKRALEHLGLRPDARAETLRVEDWIQLCGRLNTR